MRSALALAQLEVVRFVRRGDGVLVLVLFLAMGLAPVMSVRAPAETLEQAWRQDTVRPWLEPVAALESLRAVIVTVHVVLLAGVALGLGWSSWRRDLLEGNWQLVLQAPVGPTWLVAGKAGGVGLCLLVTEGAFQLGLVSTTPLIDRSSASLFAEALLAWLFAASFVPDGLAEARAEKASTLRYAAWRTWSVLRLGVPVAGLVIVAVTGPVGSSLEAPFVAFLQGAPPRAALSLAPSTSLLWALAAWQVGGALATWLAFVRPWRR